MRQIGTLPNEQQTKRFVDYLLTQGISARADEEADNSWALWIHDEEQIGKAAEELRSFQANSEDPRYREVSGKAKDIRQRDEQKRAAAAKNIVQMRGHWQQGPEAPGSRYVPADRCRGVGRLTDEFRLQQISESNRAGVVVAESGEAHFHGLRPR